MSLSTLDLVDSVATTLLDPLHDTWSFDELVGYLNEGLRATASVKPDMYIIEEFVTPTAGIVQTLPLGTVGLFDITHNADGRVVTLVDKALLEEANRFWPRATQQAQVEHYTADPRDPRRFTVFPPNNGAGSIWVIRGAVPPVLTGSSGEELVVSETYQNILANFMLHKAYAKNTKRQDLAKSGSYYSMWGQGVGLRATSQVAVAPRVSQTPGE